MAAHERFDGSPSVGTIIVLLGHENTDSNSLGYHAAWKSRTLTQESHLIHRAEDCAALAWGFRRLLHEGLSLPALRKCCRMPRPVGGELHFLYIELDAEALDGF